MTPFPLKCCRIAETLTGLILSYTSFNTAKMDMLV